MSYHHGQTSVPYDETSAFVYPRKLDTALREETTLNFMTRLRANKLTYQDDILTAACIKHFPGFSWDLGKINHHCWPSIFLKCITDGMKGKGVPFRTIHMMSNAALRNIDLQIQYMCDNITVKLKDQIIMQWELQKQRMTTLPPVLFKLLECIQPFQTLVETLPKINIRSDIRGKERRIHLASTNAYYKIENLDLEICWSSEICVIKHQNTYHICPTTYILLMYNKLCDIISVILLAYYGDGTTYETGSFDKTIDFIKQLALVAKQLQTKFFHLAKVLEGLVTSMTLMEVDDASNREFYDALVYDLLAEHDIDIHSQGILEMLSCASIALRHELGCLSKIMGHPFVSIKKGAEKLYNQTNEALLIDQELVSDCVRHCKLSFLKQYIIRHKKWPAVAFKYGCPPRYIKAMADGRDPEAARYKNLYSNCELQDMDYIELQKVMEYDMLENFIPYLKDRTLSVCRSKVLNNYLNKSETRTRIEWKETRLLLYYLLSDKTVTDHVNYILKYDTSTTLDDLLNYLVIRIVPKEKELKTEPRGFGCKTYLDRARTIVQEKNAMHYLDLYSEDQAMTLGELDILKRLSSFRRINLAYPGYTPLYIVIDSSGWNNKFRHETVNPVMREVLDKLFGVSHYGKTMMAYEQSLLYIPDSGGTYWWDGQLGGIEGLNQDTWVITYIAQIRATLKNVGMPYHLFCKGDDMRVVLLVPPEILECESILDVKNRIVSQISELALKLGHTINISESYGSCHYFAFSKSASSGSIELPQTYRKIQKCYGANNAFLNLLDDYIGASYSNAHSACKVGTNFIGPYYVAVVWSNYYLLTDNLYKQLSEAMLIGILLVPGIVGGFPIIYLHNMMVRAESDLLSPAIGLLLFAFNYSPEIYTVMRSFYVQTISPSREAFIGLLIDPYSLPIIKPSHASTILRGYITPALEHMVRNEDVKQLFELAKLGLNEQLEEALFQANVYNAKMFSAIYALTPNGLIMELVRKFETGRSILELIILRWGKRRASQMFQRVFNADKILHQYRLNLVVNGITKPTMMELLDINSSCPGEIASLLRSKLWGKPVESISMSPLQHQISITSRLASHEDDWACNNHFTYYIYPPCEYMDEYHLPTYSVANIAPFLGYTTRLGLVQPSVHFVEKDLLLSKIKLLIELASWARADCTINGVHYVSNLDRLIYHLLTMYIPIDPLQIAPFGGSKRSGTVQHHVRAPNFRESIVPNVLSNGYQNIRGESNTHVTLRHSGQHYNVNFMHIYCYVASVLQLVQQLSLLVPEDIFDYWIVTSQCTYCAMPITETPVVIPMQYIPTKPLITLTSTPIGQNALNIVYTSLAQPRLEFQYTRLDEFGLNDKFFMTGVLQDFVETTFSTRVRLSECHGQHSMTHEALQIMIDLNPKTLQRDSGTSELQRIPIKYLAHHLYHVISEYIITTYTDVDSHSIATILYSMPGSEQPWHMLVEKMYQIGKLGSLLRQCGKDAGLVVPAIFDSIQHSTIFIGHCSYLATLHLKPKKLRVVYLSSYEIHDVIRQIVPLFNTQRHRLLHNIVYPAILDALRTVETNREQFVISCQVAFLLWCMKPPDTETLEGQTVGLPLNAQVVIPLIGLASLDTTNYYQFQDDIEFWPENMVKYFSRFKKYPLKKYFQHLEDNEQEIGKWFDNQAHTTGLVLCYTDLHTCINHVRGLSRVDAFVPVRLRNQPVDVDLPSIRYTLRPNSFIGGKHRESSSTLYMHDVIEITRPDVHLINTYMYYRHYCYGTAAVNKLFEILHFLSLTYFPHGGNYACLADGYGGFTAGVSRSTRESKILFNSLYTFDQVEVRPDAAIEVSEMFGNELIYDEVLQGISDLTESLTFKHFEKRGLKYAFISCDADTREMDIQRRNMLLANILVFYCRNSTPKGGLCIKLYMNEREQLMYLIGIISKHCAHWGLIKPLASGYNQEIYLIAQECTFQPMPTYDMFKFQLYPDVKLQVSLDKYIDSVYNHILLQMTTNQYCITLSPDIAANVAFRDGVPLFFESICSSSFGFTLTRAMIDTSLEKNGHEEFFIGVSQLIAKSREKLFSELDKSSMMKPGRQTWNDRTLKHMAILCERILMLDGLTIVGYHGQRTTFQYGQNVIRTSFHLTIDTLPKRLRLYDSPFPLELFSSNYLRHGIQWNLYPSYIKGFNFGLSLLGYVHRTMCKF
nr:MAG: RNA-dependent RNA polymerase [Millipede chuvirus]